MNTLYTSCYITMIQNRLLSMSVIRCIQIYLKYFSTSPKSNTLLHHYKFYHCHNSLNFQQSILLHHQRKTISHQQSIWNSLHWLVAPKPISNQKVQPILEKTNPSDSHCHFPTKKIPSTGSCCRWKICVFFSAGTVILFSNQIGVKTKTGTHIKALICFYNARVGVRGWVMNEL